MKKIAMLLAALFISALLCINATAATQEFVDTLEDNYPLVFEKSENLRYEKNADVNATFYEKYSANGDISATEYMVYKLDDNIVGFKIDTMHVNGLGNPETDISVFVSADNKEWKEIATECSELGFDSEYYVNEDLAYWRTSTITNKNDVEAGYNYIKIQINPFTVKESVVWNTVIDTVTVTYGELEQTESEKEELTSSKNESGANNNNDNNNNNNSNTLIIVIAIIGGAVIIAAAVVTVILVSNKKKKAE